MAEANQTVKKALDYLQANSSAKWQPDYSTFEKIETNATGVVYTPLEDGWIRINDNTGGDYRGGTVYFGTSTSGIAIGQSYQNRYPGAAVIMVPGVAGQQYFVVSNQNTVYFHKLLK